MNDMSKEIETMIREAAAAAESGQIDSAGRSMHLAQAALNAANAVRAMADMPKRGN